MKTLIIGLGNELYGDDGVAIHVIRQLKKEKRKLRRDLPPSEEIDLEECRLSGLSLLEVITGYGRLIIIDTIKKTDPETGRIHRLKVKDLRHIPGPSPHYVSVPQTLAIGKKLGLRVPEEIKIIAVEAKNMYNLGEGLSPEMTEALPSIVQEVRNALKKR